MSEGKFWLGVWTIISGTLLGILIINAVYYNNKLNKITEMVISGADPMQVSCAINDSFDRKPSCITVIVQK